MKKKNWIYSDLQGFRHGYSAIGDIMEEMQKKEQSKQYVISASYAMTSSYQYRPISISGSFLPPSWSDANGKPLTASWVSGPTTPFIPFETLPKNDMNKLKENLDFLYTCKLDLEEQVAELKEQNSNLKYNSAGFLARKDTIELELDGMISQRDGLQTLLKEEKICSANDINFWKLKYDAAESNHKFAVNHCTELNKTIRIAKDEVTKLRNEKVNDEQLARQLLLKKDELESVLKKIAILEKENESYREQTYRLVNENSKLSCPGQYLPEVQTCGKCTSCLLEQANRVRQELADHLAASKKESEGYRQQMDSLRYEREAAQSKCATLDTAITNLEAENRKLVLEQCGEHLKNISKLDHLQTIITLLMRGLKDIIGCGVFARKGVAEVTLKAVNDYRKSNNIENVQLYGDVGAIKQ